jgi:hypothetical protein
LVFLPRKQTKLDLDVGTSTTQALTDDVQYRIIFLVCPV